MLFTSASANKYLKQLEAEKRLITSREMEAMAFTAATVENVDDVRPEYDFETTQNALSEIEKKYLKVKHALSVFNTTTKLVDFEYNRELTIDAALTYMAMLTEKIEKLMRMAKLEAKKSYSYNNGLIVYKYTNYNPVDAANAYQDAQAELHSLQLALDKANNTITFEVDVEY